MSSSLGPLEIDCDAPPYSVVCACRRVDLQDPEDVRWCRLGPRLDIAASEWDLLKRQPWKLLVRLSASNTARCVCGQKLPSLDRYTFTYLTGHESSFLLGQCKRCRTIYWEEM
jgi:hypothetical protein